MKIHLNSLAKMRSGCITKTTLRLVGLTLLFFLASCTTTHTYNPEYEGRILPSPGVRLEGRAIILTTDADDNYVFVGNPTSFTGGGTKIDLPLGMITREIAQNTFDRLFEEGAMASNNLSAMNNYSVAISPKISNFSYAYNQLKNAGFLVTPQVEISITVNMSDSSGNRKLDKTYISGTKDGDSYAFSGSPGERINKLAHEVITELLNQVASDIYYLTTNSE
jgi:hypothetical protein